MDRSLHFNLLCTHTWDGTWGAIHHLPAHTNTPQNQTNTTQSQAFEPRHLEAIAQSADNIINDFLSSDSSTLTLDTNPTIQDAANAAAAANAVVPPVGSGEVGVVKMQKLPWPGSYVFDQWWD